MILHHWTGGLPWPYMVKTLKKSFSPVLRKLRGWILVYRIGDSRSTKFVQIIRLGWPLTFLWFGQICIPVAVAILEECCVAFCKYAIAVFFFFFFFFFIMRAKCGPWASCLCWGLCRCFLAPRYGQVIGGPVNELTCRRCKWTRQWTCPGTGSSKSQPEMPVGNSPLKVKAEL